MAKHIRYKNALKLTPEVMKVLRQRYDRGATLKTLAKERKVCTGTIRRRLMALGPIREKLGKPHLSESARALVVEAYCEGSLPLPVLASEYGIHERTLSRYVHDAVKAGKAKYRLNWSKPW